VQALGRPAEMKLLCDRHKGPQVPKFHALLIPPGNQRDVERRLDVAPRRLLF
jgi:hypothetical protein